MAKDPAINFYTGDFLNGCTDLDMTERGQYITLLCVQHQKGHLSKKTIKLAVGDVSKDVLTKFIVDAQGLFYNERMEAEIIKRAKFIQSQKDKINKRWHGLVQNGISPVSSGVIPIEIRNQKSEITNPKSEIRDQKNKKGAPKKLKDSQAEMLEREKQFEMNVYQYHVDLGPGYPEEMLKDFVRYWTEPNKSRTKMRYELEKVFDIPRRLATWASRDNGFSKKPVVNALISYRELVELVNKGEDMAKWEMVTPGDKKSLWKLKKP
jgi:hypothetical protein